MSCLKGYYNPARKVRVGKAASLGGLLDIADVVTQLLETAPDLEATLHTCEVVARAAGSRGDLNVRADGAALHVVLHHMRRLKRVDYRWAEACSRQEQGVVSQAKALLSQASGFEWEHDAVVPTAPEPKTLALEDDVKVQEVLHAFGTHASRQSGIRKVVPPHLEKINLRAALASVAPKVVPPASPPKRSSSFGIDLITPPRVKQEIVSPQKPAQDEAGDRIPADSKGASSSTKLPLPQDQKKGGTLENKGEPQPSQGEKEKKATAPTQPKEENKAKVEAAGKSKAAPKAHPKNDQKTVVAASKTKATPKGPPKAEEKTAPAATKTKVAPKAPPKSEEKVVVAASKTKAAPKAQPKDKGTTSPTQKRKPAPPNKGRTLTDKRKRKLDVADGEVVPAKKRQPHTHADDALLR